MKPCRILTNTNIMVIYRRGTPNSRSKPCLYTFWCYISVVLVNESSSPVLTLFKVVVVFCKVRVPHIRAPFMPWIYRLLTKPLRLRLKKIQVSCLPSLPSVIDVLLPNMVGPH